RRLRPVSRAPPQSIDRRYFAWSARLGWRLERKPESGKEPAELRPGLLRVPVGQVGVTIRRRCVETDLWVLPERPELAGLRAPYRCEVGDRERQRPPARA